MVSKISVALQNLLLSMGVYAPIFSCLLIVLESIVPILPLCIFITINFIYFGKLYGFLISWIFTCIGCIISYFISKKGTRIFHIKNKKTLNLLNKTIKRISKLKLETLTLIIALPFTPAFLINIAAGLSKMNFKKFLISILIGKIFMVYFWGFIGTGLIDSIQNPNILIKISIILITSYLISYIIKKIIKL
ncbi:MAG: TVP38/TMEM64 family protein [Bacilli bacterium]